MGRNQPDCAVAHNDRFGQADIEVSGPLPAKSGPFNLGLSSDYEVKAMLGSQV